NTPPPARHGESAAGPRKPAPKGHGRRCQGPCTPHQGRAEPPKDHIIWSLCCFLYSNPLCLGLAALIFSIKSRDRKVVGDLEGARHYGATARCLNIAATIIVCLTVIITYAIHGFIKNKTN
uniref:Uncharacterized protein n=1 Tax=Oryzias latipes TaxID=8090 RepID=A0A3B3HU79_ORYLA